MPFSPRKPFFGWYPTVQDVSFATQANITDRYGKSSVENVFVVVITAATAQKFDYEGLKLRVFDTPDLMLCDADHYSIAPFIYPKLKTTECIGAQLSK
jgi:hypothetical protein